MDPFMDLIETYGGCLTSESHLVYYVPDFSKLYERLREKEREAGTTPKEAESVCAPHVISLSHSC